MIEDSPHSPLRVPGHLLAIRAALIVLTALNVAQTVLLIVLVRR